MTFKDSIQDLIENLVKSTLNEQITWTLPTNGPNNRVEVVVDDVLFSFYVNWKLEIETGWTMSKGWISIKDEKSNFELTVYSFNFTELLTQLHEYLCDLYFNNLKPSDQPIIDRVIEITKKISIQEWRNNKINNILD
jgi:hypothetical protein